MINHFFFFLTDSSKNGLFLDLEMTLYSMEIDVLEVANAKLLIHND